MKRGIPDADARPPWWRCVREAARLDPVDLAGIPAIPQLAAVFWARHDASAQQLGVLRRLARFVRGFLRASRSSTGEIPRIEPGAVLALSFTANQRSTLAPVCRALQRRGIPVQTFELAGRGAPVAFRDSATIVAAPLLPLLGAVFFRSRGYRRRSFAWAADRYWLAYGLYCVARRWLAAGRPAMIVIANDHTLWPRTFLCAARATRIPTAYVQHAAVAPGFPRLEVDLAFLEGREALRVYEAAGPAQATAFLVGIAKLDDTLRPCADAQAGNGIAICFNAFDPARRVTEVIRTIRSEYPDAACSVRPHPQMSAAETQEVRTVATACGCSWSEPRSETIGSLLASIEFLIAGESSVLLEAAAAGAYPVMYDFSELNLDWYGFVRLGLTARCRTPEELRVILRGPRPSRDEVFARARQFCETAGTAFSGRTGELVAEVIAAQVNRNGRLHPRWRPVSDSSIPAFRPSMGHELAASI